MNLTRVKGNVLIQELQIRLPECLPVRVRTQTGNGGPR